MQCLLADPRISESYLDLFKVAFSWGQIFTVKYLSEKYGNLYFRVAESWQRWNQPLLQGTATANNSHRRHQVLPIIVAAKNTYWCGHSSIVSSFLSCLFLSSSRRLGNVWTNDFSDLVWISSGSRPDLVPILSKAPNPNPSLKRPIKTLTQLCNATDGSRVAGFQGCNVTQQCLKVPEFQDYRVPRFQGSGWNVTGQCFKVTGF